MAERKPKFFVVSKYTNRIGHRKLSDFELRNPKMFELSHQAFETWEVARAALIKARMAEIEKARKALKNAERGLTRAMQLQPADAAPHQSQSKGDAS